MRMRTTYIGVVDELLTRWGSNIRERRIRLGLNQAELAERMAVAQPTVHRWERGQMEPRREHKAKLAFVLGADVETLFPMAAA